MHAKILGHFMVQVLSLSLVDEFAYIMPIFAATLLPTQIETITRK